MRDSLRRLARRRLRPAAPASPATARAARRTRRRRLVVGGTAGALALLLAGGGVAFALGRSGGPGYRTATAELGTVEQTVDTTGTVASAGRADRSFSVAGTVGSVAVAVGDTVAAGQVLASLDPASLQDAVDEAEQAVADAQQRLEDDIASQTSTSTSSSSASSSSSSSSSSSAGGATTGAVTPDTGTSGGTGGSSGSDGSGGSGGGATDPAVTAAVAAVTAAQQALLAQHETARAALATATDAVAAAQDTCQVFLELDLGGETPDATTPDATKTADAEGVAADEGTGTATPGTEELAACQDATSAVLAAQTAVDEAQTALASLATDLDAAVLEALRALAAASGASGASGGSGTTTPGATTEPGTTTLADTGTTATTGTDQSATAQTATGAPTTGGTGGTGSTGGAGGSTVASAADLLADQAAIDQAEADLAVAQSALGMVDLTTPIAGTVASVAIAAGDAVEASSTTSVITVLGEDGYTVSTTVSLSQVDLVEVGQSAQVRAGSTDEELTGTVTGIGLLNASTTSSDPSYTVDIALDPSDAALFDGSSAQVSIAVAASDATLTVPSSAVHLDGGTATVQVLRDGTVEEVEVERGAVGPERTEIADGLAEGDEVVLADLGQAMTTDDATSGTGLSGLGGSSDQAPDQVRGGMMVPGGQTGGGQMMAPPGS
ncbi:hypothetical protein CHO01_07540 [Cellulomonas hominis]|uniref:HlyD family secretion protein n=1 Tax=Cellulomonas hominis TaxID=156981 RepID=A0A511FCU7_9CELL|nr:efflux RND transporter periplasmic adaptor subunit [Cellulomonas hominis]MBB5472425.1 HlyD family secretion protein [Cellulomonas hominis]GEL45638.1 hypothetical protein CHO01_07540 [Cellulomonas hominis]